MTKKEICLAYLNLYAEKNLDGIGELFAKDVVLRDWNLMVRGKSDALSETRKNFNAVETIEIQVLFLHESQDSVAAELKITLNGADELYVADVITFNSSGKIQSIRAYKGSGGA